jgi:hypothetical protein
MEFTTNTTSQASAGFEESSSIRVTWQNPVFPMPSPRTRSSSSDRIPGTVYSHRPRWTPAKHARILAEIKATRTDLDPSFPRPSPVSANTDQTSTASALKDAVQNAAQYTKSYFYNLTEHAVNMLYPTTSTTSTTSTATSESAHASKLYSLGRDPAIRKKAFFDSLVVSNFSEAQATDVMLAWTELGIPFLEYTLPGVFMEEFAFFPEDKQKSVSSGASIVEISKNRIIKCYPPSSEVDLHRLTDLTGIDHKDPKLEVRCLLASYIAHEILGWNITPKASPGFFGGRVCVVSERIDGTSLWSRLSNSLPLATMFFGSMQDGVMRVEKWKGHLGEEFQRDYLRLSLFAMLIGDFDRHPNQFITKGEPLNFVRGIDWDVSFGRKLTTDEIYVDSRNGKYVSLWPTSIPKGISDDFARVTKENLKEAAEAFGLSQEEVDALMSRFQVVTKKLATIKKT